MLSNHRLQTRGEETANSISHGLGLAFSFIATPFMILNAVHIRNTPLIVGASVFGATSILLYLASTFYHSIPHRFRRVKHLFQTLDHAGIFLLIAGSYTPFTLGALRGALGWTLFGIVWAIAFFGIIWKSTGPTRHPWLSNLLYLLMGWLVIIAIKPLWQQLPPASLIWLIAGGLAYTIGIVFYIAERWKYTHFIWHLFVITGTTCHFLSVCAIRSPA